MNWKFIGYLFAIGGLFSITAGIKLVYSNFYFLQKIPQNLLIFCGMVLVVFGVILISLNNGGGKVIEVPIYEGKEVVGYRRIKKRS
ncbi:MAG: hypothetical protein QXU40_03500 [Candidatus Pacearchaeota archaeon]